MSSTGCEGNRIAPTSRTAKQIYFAVAKKIHMTAFVCFTPRLQRKHAHWQQQPEPSSHCLAGLAFYLCFDTARVVNC